MKIGINIQIKKKRVNTILYQILNFDFRTRCHQSDSHTVAANKIHENILTCLEQKEITQYSARIEQIANSKLDAFLTPETGNLSQVQFIIKFTSNSRTIHEEMQIHDEIWLLGSLGGSLGLFIGFSFFGSVATLLDKLIDMLSKA